MTKLIKSALKKIKAANLTPEEAMSVANWFGQTIVANLDEDGLSDKDFQDATIEVAGMLIK